MDRKHAQLCLNSELGGWRWGGGVLNNRQSFNLITCRKRMNQSGAESSPRVQSQAGMSKKRREGDVDSKRMWSPAMDKFFGQFNTPKTDRTRTNLTSTPVVNPSQPEVPKEDQKRSEGSTIESLDSTEVSAMVEANLWLENGAQYSCPLFCYY